MAHKGPSDEAIREAGAQFERLIQVMRTLRSPEGCPWDREQTLDTLRPFLLQETYEALDAIDHGNRAALASELGDVVFEAVFLAQICAEDGDFTIADAVRAIVDKLVRRHPHVFGREGDRSPDIDSTGVLEQWERLKQRERQASGETSGVLGGISRSLPSLLRAHEIGARVGAVGFDWPRADDVLDKIHEELEELRHAVATEGRERTEEEMGDLLFALANLSRKLGIEPESALRRANDKFSARFAAMEKLLDAQGTSIHEAGSERLERVWTQVKGEEETG